MLKIYTVEFINKNKERRYRVISRENGEVLADGNGYGYKTREGAYKAYYYLNRDKSLDKERLIGKIEAHKYLAHHPRLWDYLDNIYFEICRGRITNLSFDKELFKSIMEESGIKEGFTYIDLYYAYMNPPKAKDYETYKRLMKDRNDSKKN